MLETSKDLLNVVLAISVFLVAVFFSWILYQMGRALKGVNDIIKNVQEIVESAKEAVNTIKSKGAQAAGVLNLAVKAGQQIIKQVNKRKAKPKKSSDKKDK